jgi:predicted  nucleic acid-binding Zn-ribbon protein
MTPIPRTNLLLALLATGTLVLGAFALSVEAKPGDGNATQERRDAAQEKREAAQAAKEERKEMKEERKELRDEIKEACKDAKDNSTLKQRCEHLKDAVKARRVAHALLTAIRVHERELGRVTFRIHEAEQKLNGTGLNATERHSLEVRLDHLEQRQARLIEKIADERAKLQTLHDKWAEVADHVRDREKHGEDEDDA